MNTRADAHDSGFPSKDRALIEEIEADNKLSPKEDLSAASSNAGTDPAQAFTPTPALSKKLKEGATN